MFQKAERKQSKLKIGLTGPSGSGKTYSALCIAKGIGGKIAVIDTENLSANLYADRFDFDSCALEAPFITEKYLKAMKSAEDAKYDVVIIDSATHQWMGEGGVYDRKTQIDARGGNSFTNWSKFTPEHNKFLSAIVQHNTHLIVTVRAKTDYVMSSNDKGKTIPQKAGIGPVQRDGFEYELTTMFDLAMDHSAQASKDRTSLFDGQTFKPSEETGKILMAWLNGAKQIEPATTTVVTTISNEMSALISLQKQLRISNEDLKKLIQEEFKMNSLKDMSSEQIRKIIELLKAPAPWELEAMQELK